MRPVIDIAVAVWFLASVASAVMMSRPAYAQERDAFDVDIIPAASKHLGVVHELGFERVDVRELVALTGEKRGQGKPLPARFDRDRSAREKKPRTSPLVKLAQE